VPRRRVRRTARTTGVRRERVVAAMFALEVLATVALRTMRLEPAVLAARVRETVPRAVAVEEVREDMRLAGVFDAEALRLV